MAEPTELQLDVFNGIYLNVDNLELSNRDSRIVDAYTDEAGFLVKRPGIASFATLTNSTVVAGA